MKKFIIILLITNALNADSETIKDIQARSGIYLKFANETQDLSLKKFWKDKADVELALVLFLKRHYGHELNATTNKTTKEI